MRLPLPLAIGLGFFFANVGSTIGPEPMSPRPDFRRLYARPVGQWPAPRLDANIAFEEFAPLPSPPENTLDKRLAALGRRLFHDHILSAKQDVSCATCHREVNGWSIATAVATGHERRRGRRNPPALYTATRQPHLGWGGRETSLAAQALRPLTLADEMGNPDVEAVLRRVSSDARYADDFAAINAPAEITAEGLAGALIAFLATLDQPTRLDRFLAGEYDALSDREIWGLHLFRTKARCINCHFGPRLADGRFHNLKISFFGEKSADLGRYEATGRPGDAGRFRTPSLRHISKTAPYMHNGLFETLAGVVNLYDRGGGEVWARNAEEAAHPLYAFAARRSPHIRELNLSPEEKAALVSFLKSL